MTIGERIKELRTANNMLQSELAKRLGVTRSAVSAWEVGRTEPNLEIIEKMSKVFNCLKTDIIGADVVNYLVTSGDDEFFLVEKYRKADKETKEMVRRILNYSPLRKESL